MAAASVEAVRSRSARRLASCSSSSSAFWLDSARFFRALAASFSAWCSETRFSRNCLCRSASFFSASKVATSASCLLFSASFRCASSVETSCFFTSTIAFTWLSSPCCSLYSASASRWSILACSMARWIRSGGRGVRISTNPSELSAAARLGGGVAAAGAAGAGCRRLGAGAGAGAAGAGSATGAGSAGAYPCGAESCGA